jgi:dUTP pyrophosphatase
MRSVYMGVIKKIKILFKYAHEIENMLKEPIVVVNDLSRIRLGSEEASGLDILSDVNETIKSGETKFINSGLRVQLPRGVYGDIRPRSGLSKIGIQVQLGLIDSDYTGYWGVLIYNSSKEDYTISIGERVGQLVLHRDLKVRLYEGVITKKTKRGNKGFGSTGK